jgi:hypothetical protein
VAASSALEHVAALVAPPLLVEALRVARDPQPPRVKAVVRAGDALGFVGVVHAEIVKLRRSGRNACR